MVEYGCSNKRSKKKPLYTSFALNNVRLLTLDEKRIERCLLRPNTVGLVYRCSMKRGLKVSNIQHVDSNIRNDSMKRGLKVCGDWSPVDPTPMFDSMKRGLKDVFDTEYKGKTLR